MDCKNELKDFCSRHNLELHSELNEIIIVKNNLLSIYFRNDNIHNSIDMDIIDTHNNNYSLTAISLFLIYSKSSLLSGNNSELTNLVSSSKSLNDTLSFGCRVINLLNNIEHEYNFILEGNFSWSKKYFAFWESVKNIGHQILKLDEENPLRKKYLNPLGKPLDWLEEAIRYFKIETV